MPKSKNTQNSEFICEYCKKEFKRETTILKHLCDKKRRALSKSDKSSVFAFSVYQYWYNNMMGTKKQKTYDEFANSSSYNIFVKISNYIEKARIDDWQKYIIWVSKQQIRVDDWAKDKTYKQYIMDTIKKETPERAIEKYIMYVKLWSERTGNSWDEYFLKSNPENIVNLLCEGTLSPWILFCSNSAQNFINELPDDLLIKLNNDINLEYWSNRVNKCKEDCEWIRSLIP